MYGTSSYRKSESPKSHKPEITSVALEGMVENQKLKLQNEAAHLAMREREMTLNGELAKKSMDIDLELEKKRPGETRKNFLALGVTVITILLILLLFFGYCLHLGKEQFVLDCVKYTLYPASVGGGYWIGRHSKKMRNNLAPSIDEAKIIYGDS